MKPLIITAWGLGLVVATWIWVPKIITAFVAAEEHHKQEWCDTYHEYLKQPNACLELYRWQQFKRDCQ